MTSEQIALIEAVLFVSKDPLEPGRIMDFLQITDAEEFEKTIQTIEKEHFLDRPERGLLLKRSGGGLQLVTKPELHDALKEFFTIKQVTKLT